MSFELIQAFYDWKCTKCDNTIKQGQICLETRGFGSWTYCQECTCNKGYRIEQLRTFRPEKLGAFNDFGI